MADKKIIQERKKKSQLSYSPSNSSYNSLNTPIIDSNIALLIAQLQNPLTGVNTKDYKWRFQTHKQCFTGIEALNWILANTQAETPEEGELIGQKLLDAGAFKSLSSSNISFKGHSCLYQLQRKQTLDDVNNLDDLFKEYLLYRGLTETLITFDKELKQDKFHQLEATQIVQELFNCINTSNLPSLLDLWRYLDSALISRVDKKHSKTASELENNLYKYYIVYAIQNNNYSKVHEFFKKCVNRISQDANWSPWFYLPYTKCPQKVPEFAVYFTNYWVEHLSTSLTNFISTCLHEAPSPRLLLYNMEKAARETLEQQVQLLRKQNEELKQQNIKLQDNNKSKKVNTVLKIDANKPMPAQEQDDISTRSYLGKQRKDTNDKDYI